MALITCPECANQYDDNAASCPNCGRPNPTRAASETPRGGPAGGPANGFPGGQPGGAQGYPPSGGAPYGGGHAGGPGYGPPAAIPNYLVQSILVTLCCCLIPGIVAIVYAAQVNSKRDMGDLHGALEASNNAKRWCWIAFGLGIVAHLISWVFFGASMLAAIAGAGAEAGY